MKKVKNWFTLIELLVAITVLTLIILATSKVNFNQHINSQKAIEFTNSIYTKMENIRNESLMWKSVWTNVIFPDNRKITINTGSFTSTYSTWSDIPLESFNFQAKQSVVSASCTPVNWVNSWALTLPITFTYIEDKIETIDTSWTPKKCIWNIKFQTKYKSIVNEISINTITWVMEQQKK